VTAEPRYRKLETLRGHACPQLKHGIVAMAVRERHAGYFQERAEPKVHSTDQGLWFDRVDRADSGTMLPFPLRHRQTGRENDTSTGAGGTGH
jgi:hypothetical protein